MAVLLLDPTFAFGKSYGTRTFDCSEKKIVYHFLWKPVVLPYLLNDTESQNWACPRTAQKPGNTADIDSPKLEMLEPSTAYSYSRCIQVSECQPWIRNPLGCLIGGYHFRMRSSPFAKYHPNQSTMFF